MIQTLCRWVVVSIFVLLGTSLWAEAPMGAALVDGGVSFRVWAPNAHSVKVMGDFNGWNPGKRDTLTKDPATGIWSGVLRSPRVGQEYLYLINDHLQRRDPYARQVTLNGKHSVIYDPSEFDWQGDEPLTQDPDDLVIYEMHIGTFNDTNNSDRNPGTFEDAIKKLDVLKTMGINCVCVMPIHNFFGEYSWGYNPCDMFAVEPAYGGPDGFKEFVKACHDRGIAVHLDIVHNHYGPETLDLLQFDGSGSPNRGGIYFYDGADDIAMTPWGPRVNFEQAQVRQFIKDNALMWLDEYHVDGFRWDSTSNIRAYNEGSTPLPSGAKMLEDINSHIRKHYPERLSIAEDSLNIGNFHGSWEYDFHHQMHDVLSAQQDADRPISKVASCYGSPSGMFRVIYTDNHDEAGKINGQVRTPSDIDPDSPNSPKAKKLSGLAAVVTLTAPGVPLLFMGNEMLETGYFHDDIPIQWGKMRSNRETVLLHKDLIALRRNLSGEGRALMGNRSQVPVMDDTTKTLVAWREHEDHPNEKMVIAFNFSGGPPEKTVLSFPVGGSWKTVLDTEWSQYGGSKIQKNDKPFTLPANVTKVQVALPPYSARIFTLVKPAKTQTAAPAKPVKKAGPTKSDYYAITVAGNFNDWNPVKVHMERIQDYVWAHEMKFNRTDNVELKLCANTGWKVHWGATDNTPVTLPHTGTLIPDGESLVIPGPVDATFQLTFDERTRELTLTELSSSTPEASDTPALRTWTSRNGTTLQAAFIDLKAGVVRLEKEDGSQLNVKISALSPEDQRYLRTLR